MSPENIQADGDAAYPKFLGTPQRNLLLIGAIIAALAYVIPAATICIATGFKFEVFATYLIGEVKVLGNIVWLVEGLAKGRPLAYWPTTLMTISQVIFWVGLVMVAIGLVRKLRSAA